MDEIVVPLANDNTGDIFVLFFKSFEFWTSFRQNEGNCSLGIPKDNTSLSFTYSN